MFTLPLDFMYSEMSTSLKNKMISASNVSDACVDFHNIYEGSADTASQIQGRVNNAQNVYNKYHDTDVTPKMTGGIYPTNLAKGGSFTVGGTVSSASKFNWVWMGVNPKGSNDHVLETEAWPGSNSYDISKSASKLDFTKLDKGEYTFQVHVITENPNNYYTVVNQPFIVIEAEHEHSFDSGEITKEATCTETGIKILTCSSKITISGISKQIASGKEIKLTASVLPENASNKTVTWKSNNTKVATVNSSGVVTMNRKSGGKTVTITATATDGSGVQAIYKIKSMKGVVKKVSISGSKSVKAGKSLKLKAKVTATKGANKKLKWTSSNPKYAQVTSSGKVKTYKAGKGKKVKITAMATDGSGKKKTVIIKIK